MEYILVQDDSCHWYIIPLEEKERFYEWAYSEDNWDLEDWMEPVERPVSSVAFKEWRFI